MNCLAFALRYWKKNPLYTIVYNQKHVINVPYDTIVPGFSPLESFEYEDIFTIFKDKLSLDEKELLMDYFKPKFTDIINWHLDTAILFLDEHGFKFRIVKNNNKYFVLIRNFLPNRVNLFIENGFVTKITLG